MICESGSSVHHRRAASPVRIGFVLGIVLLAALPQRAAAATVGFEAENYVASLDLGGDPIRITTCVDARGGLAVNGVDYQGDYIQWSLSLPSSFVFRDSLRSAGAVGLVRRFVVLFLPAGGSTPVAADTLVTPPGKGMT